MTSARLFIQSEKLAQADDKFPKRLNASAWGRHTEHSVNTESDVLLIRYHLVLSNCYIMVGFLC